MPHEAHIGSTFRWEQQVVVLTPGSTSPELVVTPSSGKVQIHYTDDDGQRWWWDGSQFVTTEKTLDTTISGDLSVFEFEIPNDKSLVGETVTVEGWIDGTKATLDSEILHIHDTRHSLDFG